MVNFGDGLEFNGGTICRNCLNTADLQLGDEHTMMAWLYVTNIARTSATQYAKNAMNIYYVLMYSCRR